MTNREEINLSAPLPARAAPHPQLQGNAHKKSLPSTVWAMTTTQTRFVMLLTLQRPSSTLSLVAEGAASQQRATQNQLCQVTRCIAPPS